MYKTCLFSDYVEVAGNVFKICFLPDFRQDVTMYYEEREYYVDVGQITKKDDEYGFSWVSVSQNASWLLEVYHLSDTIIIYYLYIIAKTRDIKTPLGEEFNRRIMNLVKQARLKYNTQKETELRLYFYNSQKRRLILVENYNRYEQAYKYSLSRPFHNNSIDKKCEEPRQDCYIIGRVTKTIGTKNEYLHDFIEPVYYIYLDFKRNPNDYFDDYNDKLIDFHQMLMRLLLFSIKKEHNNDIVETKRVVEYIRKQNSVSNSEEAVKMFISEIYDAYKNNDLKKLRNLYKSLDTMQDCSKSIFYVTTVHRDIDTVFIKYENGEQQFVDTAWVEKNKGRCANYG